MGIDVVIINAGMPQDDVDFRLLLAAYSNHQSRHRHLEALSMCRQTSLCVHRPWVHQKILPDNPWVAKAA
jgi:hypothetical protein